MSKKDRIYIRPATGRDGAPYRVRKHDKPAELLAADGEWTARTPYWLRRLRDGSVVEAAPPKPVKATGKE